MKLKLTGVPPPRKKAAMFFAHPSKSMAKMLRRHPPTMKGRRRPKRDLERLFTKQKEREGGREVSLWLWKVSIPCTNSAMIPVEVRTK